VIAPNLRPGAGEFGFQISDPLVHEPGVAAGGVQPFFQHAVLLEE